MKRIFSSFTTLLLTSSFILITSCSSGTDGGGGGGGTTTFSGNTAPAAIDATNAAAIGTTSGEAIQKADASTGLPGSISISSSVDMDKINALVLAAANNATANNINTPAGVDISSSACSSGGADANFGSATSGPVDLITTYTNCTLIGDNITFNGTVVIHFNDVANTDAGFTITYSNFTVIDPENGTTTINATITCSNASNCTINSDFVGSDGATHRIGSFSVSGNATSGFNGSATFFHSSYGEVMLTFSNITYGSCGVKPDGGDISFSSTNGTSGTIIFNSGCTVSGTWFDGTGSGSF